MRSAIRFFAITYLVSWSFFITAVILSRSNQSPISGIEPIPRALILIGTIAPSLIALALTARYDGKEATRRLLQRVVQFPSSLRYYVFAVGYMLVIRLGVVLAYRFATGAWPQFGDEPAYIILAAIVFGTPVQAGEEIGWRGYALPRLASRFGLGWAAIVIGVVWASWHLPLFFIPGSPNFGQSFPVYLLAVTAISVGMAWLYWRTNGSLFITMLMHSSINNIAGIVRGPVSESTNPFTLRPSLFAWLTAGLMWMWAVYLLVRMRWKSFEGSYDKDRIDQI